MTSRPDLATFRAQYEAECNRRRAESLASPNPLEEAATATPPSQQSTLEVPDLDRDEASPLSLISTAQSHSESRKRAREEERTALVERHARRVKLTPLGDRALATYSKVST